MKSTGLYVSRLVSFLSHQIREFQRGFRDSLAESEALQPGYARRVRTLLPIYVVLVATMIGTLLFGFSSAQAASADDVSKVVTCMQTHTCKNVIARKTYGEGFVGEQIVFRVGGKRYTLYWPGSLWSDGGEVIPKEKQWLAVWVRPEGTASRELIETCSDWALDGTANNGITGSPVSELLFEDNTDKDDGQGTNGPEYRERWQKVYDEAIAAAVKRLL
jgi:hypothetical protein